ncbi:tRNA lysidine(34) synthetase TilS [Pelagerythrobacter rhizovicinus]|uniref:tRNA(Ile)-lysidine synthase n=1 Tax=Pelagerythrobacter rhizovicinus TaxID=2268576 RepID=A0A4Q2KLC0_9SPHN|nr:tRNA lysidine(34) synthetase TilS [Pelagerythrobacter rhizovicinus]
MGLAVSGGPDSMAMLLLAYAAMPGRIEAATVDHGLRPESAGEAALVSHLCAELGVSHTTLDVDVPDGNVQDQARRARYAALEDWARGRGLVAVLTAHHADDQAETLLMRLNRASGVAGLAGVRARTVVPESDLALLRPLLGWRRAELQAVLDAAGIVAVRDPSNADERFDRVRIRQALAGADWLDAAALAQSAEHFADADEALDWAAEREWEEGVDALESGYLYRPGAPRAIRLRILARAVGLLGGAPRGGALALLDDALVRGSAANCGGVVGRSTADGWLLESEPPRRS